MCESKTRRRVLPILATLCGYVVWCVCSVYETLRVQASNVMMRKTEHFTHYQAVAYSIHLPLYRTHESRLRPDCILKLVISDVFLPFSWLFCRIHLRLQFFTILHLPPNQATCHLRVRKASLGILLGSLCSRPDLMPNEGVSTTGSRVQRDI